MTPALASSLHLLGITVAITSVVLRDRAMTATLQGGPLGPLFRADNAAGLAAMVMIGAGLWRLLAGLEKPTAWYLDEYLFHLKMTVVAIALVLEAPIMVTLLRWRFQVQKGAAPDTRRLGRLRACNRVELAGMIALLFIAPMMARGLWHKPAASPACAVEQAITTRCLTCHNAAAPQGGLILAGDARAALVGVRSTTWPDQVRVVPGDPDHSLLWRKVAGQQAPHGLSMPMGQPVDAALAATLASWISAGAPPCAP